MADIFLLRTCALCSSLFCICHRHDRGHAYCSDSCRRGGRQRSLRRARATYQRSPEGRADQRDRMRLMRLRVRLRVMDQGSEKLARSGLMVARVHACDSKVESHDMAANGTHERIDCCNDSATASPPADLGAQRLAVPAASAADPHEPVGTTSSPDTASEPIRLPSKASLRCIVCGRIGHLYVVGHVLGARATRSESLARRAGSGSAQSPPRH